MCLLLLQLTEKLLSVKRLPAAGSPARGPSRQPRVGRPWGPSAARSAVEGGKQAIVSPLNAGNDRARRGSLRTVSKESAARDGCSVGTAAVRPEPTAGHDAWKHPRRAPQLAPHLLDDLIELEADQQAGKRPGERLLSSRPSEVILCFSLER